TLELAKVTEPYGYLVKPFKEKELRSAIEIALYKSKMEKKLKEREAWLFTTLKSIGDAVIASNFNGVIMFMNTVAEELTGWEEKDAIGRPLEEVFHIINEKTRKLCENPVEKILKTGKIVGLANHTALIAKDGTECIIADSGAPIRPDNDVITGVVLVFRDITAQRKMAEELHRMKKIEAVGLLAGGIAHDYNNIMTGILGNISLAKISLDDEEEAEKVADYLSEAEAACMRAKNLSGQLITFSKGGAPVKITISIAELIRESTSFFLHGSNVKCELSLPDNLWRADVDAGQINQVVNNLVMNADQAMPGGGTVWVAAKNIIVKEEDILPLKAGEYIKISIRDQGIGIPTTYLDKIF
ncbi:MAG: PAS domain S-box protein, partial [Desulfobulbaceae bacterium]|nr:PAS domain S-box protein [Desulfobulbaceae bacterium]